VLVMEQLLELFEKSDLRNIYIHEFHNLKYKTTNKARPYL